jgi:hypothetical protein
LEISGSGISVGFSVNFFLEISGSETGNGWSGCSENNWIGSSRAGSSSISRGCSEISLGFSVNFFLEMIGSSGRSTGLDFFVVFIKWTFFFVLFLFSCFHLRLITKLNFGKIQI